jgi:hypothetical protein
VLIIFTHVRFLILLTVFELLPLAESIYIRSSIKFLHFVPFRQQIWPPRAILVSDWLMLKNLLLWNLPVLIIFTRVRFLILLTVFELLPKTCNFTLCSIFSNSSHLEWRAGLSDTILKGTHPGTIPARFGLIWFSGFRDGCCN